MERVTGIEPALSAWEAEVLPLNYTRKGAVRKRVRKRVRNSSVKYAPSCWRECAWLSALRCVLVRHVDRTAPIGLSTRKCGGCAVLVACCAGWCGEVGSGG